MSPEASGSTEPKLNDGKVRISTHTCTQNLVNIVRRVTRYSQWRSQDTELARAQELQAAEGSV